MHCTAVEYTSSALVLAGKKSSSAVLTVRPYQIGQASNVEYASNQGTHSTHFLIQVANTSITELGELERNLKKLVLT